MNDLPFYSNRSTQTITSTLYTITPSMIVATEIVGITPYSRFGVIVGIPRPVNDQFSEQTNPGGYASQHDEKMKKLVDYFISWSQLELIRVPF